MVPPTHDSFRRVRKDGSGSDAASGDDFSCIRLIFSAVYVLSAFLALIYGVCAFQYGLFNVLGLEGPFRGTPHAIAANWSRWNDAVFAPVVPTGLSYFDGDGSTTASQTVRYGRGWYFMSPHQIGGGVMILCSIILMLPRFRVGAMAKWHRTTGGVYVVAHLFNLCGSLGFLLRHGLPPTFPEGKSISLHGIYGGSLFNLVLWLYWLTGATSLSLGVFHILRGEVQRHRSWMSVNYGTTMGAGFLRLFWAGFAIACPQYKMDEINSAAALLFIPAMLCLAAGYSSFAHRKHYDYVGAEVNSLRAVLVGFAVIAAALLLNQSLLRFGSFGLNATADLNIVLGGPSLAKVSQEHALLFQDGNNTASAVAHVLFWSLGMVSGALLLCSVLHNPIAAVRGPLVGTYMLATAGVVVTTASCFGPASFSWFLIHPEPEDSHFYKTMPQVLWDSKAACLALKTAALALAVYDRDEARIVDWALHSFGDMIFPALLMPLTWAFVPLVPTYQDAYAHAAVLATLGGPLVAYIASIYLMKPEPREVSAKRKGLFGDCRRTRTAKSD